MVKKMKLPFLFKTTGATTSAAVSRPWPTCAESPRTLSFRDDDNNLPEMSNDDDDDEPEMITRLSSDRLFFEPGRTSSILEEAKTCRENNVSIMAIDSNDPVLDFRVSMKEMAEAHGLGDWESLEELLKCYLRVNDKSNHGYIVGAFVDYLLSHLSLDDDSSGSAIDGPCSSSSSDNVEYSFISPLSFSSSSTYSSASISPLENEDEIVIETRVHGSSSSSPSSSSSCKALSSGV